MNNKNWAFALSKKHIYVGAIQPCIVYWGTTNLKDEYAPNKIVIKIFIFAEFGTVLLLSENIGQCQIKNFHFFRYLIEVMCCKSSNSSYKNKIGNYLMSSWSKCHIAVFRFSHNIFTFTLTINWSSGSSKMLQLSFTAFIQLLSSAAILNLKPVKWVCWCDVT